MVWLICPGLEPRISIRSPCDSRRLLRLSCVHCMYRSNIEIGRRCKEGAGPQKGMSGIPPFPADYVYCAYDSEGGRGRGRLVGVRLLRVREARASSWIAASHASGRDFPRNRRDERTTRRCVHATDIHVIYSNLFSSLLTDGNNGEICSVGVQREPRCFPLSAGTPTPGHRTAVQLIRLEYRSGSQVVSP